MKFKIIINVPIIETIEASDIHQAKKAVEKHYSGLNKTIYLPTVLEASEE